VYALNTPIDAIDKGGKLVIFVTGLDWDQNSRQYWQSYKYVNQYKSYQDGFGNQIWGGYEDRSVLDQDFAQAVKDRLNDQNDRYYDGSLGGLSGFLKGNLSAYVRYSTGYSQGTEDAESIIKSLAHDKSGNITESIKLITHSMGGAYGKGLAQALLNYAEKHHLKGFRIAFEADFAPLNPGAQKAIKNKNMGSTFQFSHNEFVAGNDSEDGAIKMDTGSDEQLHDIQSFYKDILNLPSGSYKVVNGKIVRD